MRARWVLLGLLFSACLEREQIGVFEAAPIEDCDGGCLEDGEVLDPRRSEMERMLRQLAEGPWVGEAQSGRIVAPCRFVFDLDGHYSVALTDPAAETMFTLLFLASREQSVHGNYVLSDVLDGEFFGRFTDPYRAGVSVLSELQHMTLREGTLRFERRSVTADLALVSTQVVLKREP